MSTREEKIQLATEVDSSGALKGLKEVEAGAARMAGAVGDSAGKAGAKIDAMGDSGAQASAKLDANTRSIVASIQRATAAAEAGEKGTAKFFESLGRQRGADVGALQPYLQQLEQARKRTDSLTISTGQYTQALRMVPAQMTDVVTSLASGQDPLLVLIQQGGQLKDQFGGAGEAAKAIGRYAVGLVNPITVTAAAAAGLALAFEAGRKESALLAITAATTASTLGVTAGQMDAMVSKLSGAGYSRNAISTALVEVATNGRVAIETLEQYTLLAAELEKYTGQGVAETAKAFKALADEPTKATLKLNEALGFLTQSQYEQIKALEEQGRKTEAARIAQAAYADAVKPTIEAYKANMGALETAMDFWARKGKSMWDAITGIGRSDTGEERIAAAREKLESMRTRGGAFGQSAADRKAMIQAAQDELNYLERVTQAVRDNAAAEAKRQATQRAGIEASGAVEAAQSKGLGKQYQLNKALDDYREGLDKIRAANPESALLNPERVAAGEKAIREQFKDTAVARVNAENMQIAALRSRAVAEEEALRRLQVYGLQADKLTDGEREVLRLQEQIAVATDGRAKSVLQAELAEARRVATAQRAQVVLRESLQLERDLVELGNKQIAAINADATAIERKALALEAENEVWGKSRVAIEAATLARMEANAADVALFDGSGQVVAALDAKTAAQRRYVEALQAAELKAFNQRGDEMLRQAQELRDTYADELRMVGLSAVEREKIVAVRQVELKYAKLIADVERSSLSDAEKRAQVGKLVEAQGIESSAVVNRVLQQDFARTSAQIEQSLTDALMRGFESGKDFAEVLRDTVVNMFKTMVLRPVIQGVVQGGLNAVGLGGPAAGGGGLLGTVNNLSSLYNTGSTVAGWLGLGAATGTGLAATAGTGMALAGTSAGLGLTASAGTGLGLAGAGTGLGLSATAGAGTALTAGAGAGAAGGAAGGLAGMGPYGWAALAVLAILGSGFGKTPGEQHMGGYYSSSGKEANLDNAMAVTGGGGWDDGAWARDLVERPDAGLKSFTQLTVDAVLDSAKNSAKALGLDIALGIDAGFAANLNGKGTDKNAFGYAQIFANGELAGEYSNRELGSDMTAAGEKFAAELSDAAAKVLLAGTDFGRTGETASQTLARLGSSLTTVNTVFDTLGETAYAASLAGADLASQLADAFGGLENLTALTSSYYEAYYTEGERAATTTRQITEALGDLGFALPESRDAFRDLVEAQDLTTEAGRNTYAALIKLSPAFASVAQSAVDAARSMSSAWAQVLDARGGDADRYSAQAQIDTAWMEYKASDRYGIGAPEWFKTITQDDFKNYTAREQQLIAAIVQGYAKLNAAAVGGGAGGGSASSYFSELQSLTNSALDGLTRAIEAERELADLSARSAREAISAMEEVFGVIDTSLQSLYGQSTAVVQQSAIEARALIAQAVGGGDLPGSNELQAAIQAVQGGFDQTVYTTAFDAERDRLRFAAELSRLREAGGEQMTLAEQQLKAAEDQLASLQAQFEAAQESVNVLRGIDTGVKTVSEAIAALQAAVLAERVGAGAVAGTGGAVGGGAAAAAGSGTSGGGFSIGGQAGGVGGAVSLREGWEWVDGPFGTKIQRRIPGFAGGGDHLGGLRVVGELGPELEFTGPSRIVNHQNTMRLLQGGGANTERMEAELRALREENRAQARALVALQTRMTKVLERWDGRGLPEERTL